MALVGYSDSEDSDTEPTPVQKAPAPASTQPPPKLVDPAAPRKIKVDLPAVAAAPTEQNDRPVKRARTGGGFSGFNALLPAPKKAAEPGKKTGLGSGISLKTSSAAAFSREPVSQEPADSAQNGSADTLASVQAEDTGKNAEPITKPAEEVKIVGNAMRFKPLSVANKKKSKKPTSAALPLSDAPPKTTPSQAAPSPAPAAPKVSLFSVSRTVTPARLAEVSDNYEPLLEESEPHVSDDATSSYYAESSSAQANHSANPLNAIAADLNLSAADRRRLFGRQHADGAGVHITSFDIDREYAANEAARAAGEAVEHRAVRAVAPGKHSLQQLVNAASNQREALEDAWAEGKRNRGEAGNKYGWGR